MAETELQRTILELFRQRPDRYLSGGEVGALLGVTRASVWKQIERLRQLGYAIESAPARGYRLLARPDRLSAAELAAGLETRRIGRQLHCLAEADSTNNVAFRLAEEGAAEGTVVVADSQTKGKGRLGRSWCSPPGVNIYCSVILRPPILPVQASQLTFLSAVAVARAVIATTGLQPTIKWPNDLLLADAKVAGLLNEMSAETERVNFVVLGIGLNVNMAAEAFPSDLRQPATSLALALGHTLPRVALLQRLFVELDSLYADYLENGFPPLRSAWEGLCGSVGRQVLVSGWLKEPFIGTVLGIDADGALLVRRADGSQERVMAGDVLLVATEGNS